MGVVPERSTRIFRRPGRRKTGDRQVFRITLRYRLFAHTCIHKSARTCTPHRYSAPGKDSQPQNPFAWDTRGMGSAQQHEMTRTPVDELSAFEVATRDLVGVALRSVEQLEISLPQFRLLLVLQERG